MPYAYAPLERSDGPEEIELEVFGKKKKPSHATRRQSQLPVEIRGRHFIKQFTWTAVISFVVALYVLGSCVVYAIFSFGRIDEGFTSLTWEEFQNGTYEQHSEYVLLLEDGYYMGVSPDGYVIRRWDLDKDITLLAPLELQGHAVEKAVPQGQHVLLATEIEKRGRYSSRGYYWIYDGSAEAPIRRDDKISTAVWSPDGSLLAYVFENNVYIYSVADSQTRQITFDGSTAVFNGVPDWVYEHEVLRADVAMWWAPDGEFLAFLRIDDTEVQDFPLQRGLFNAIPFIERQKYPLPGSQNPEVELWIWSEDKLDKVVAQSNASIFTALTWVGNRAMVKLTDREASRVGVWCVDAVTMACEVVRTSGSLLTMQAVGDSGYIDRIDVDGYTHLAYFTPVNTSEPEILTSGEWEVLDKPIAVHSGNVVFHANKRSSMESTVFCVGLDAPHQLEEHPHQELSGVYSAQFSRDMQHAVVSFSGAVTPVQQDIWQLFGESTALYRNKDLTELLSSRGLLKDDLVVYGTLDLGVQTDYREIRPLNFNVHKKYPLLFVSYGDFGSQNVWYKLCIDYQRVYAETHGAVVVTVDVRGTAGHGTEFARSVDGHLGEFEAQDMLAAAQVFKSRPYVDAESTAIWGWGYGAFVALKALEQDHEHVFKTGIAVAPVTDWRLYNSVFTERHMYRPENNGNGYEQSGIRDLDFLEHARLLIVHGIEDEAVHFQQTLRLFSALNTVDVHIFPDRGALAYSDLEVLEVVDRWLSQFTKTKKRLGLRN